MTNGLFVTLVLPFFSGFVEPICLPNFGEEFEDGKMCWISGWGAIFDGGKSGKSILLYLTQVAQTRAFKSFWEVCIYKLASRNDNWLEKMVVYIFCKNTARFFNSTPSK